ncbi:MAG TPA: biopolymer transporter ExbD [Nitrospiria bacterium]|jgi:biopolymer transport protein ExbD
MFRPKKYRHHIDPPRLNLTAMVDVFTVLLIFLLKSYAAEGGLLASNPDLHLPQSTSSIKPDSTLTLVITPDLIFVQDQRVVTTREVLQSSDLFIPQVGKALEENSKRLGVERNHGGKITILGDRRIPFRLLKSILFTANETGFSDLSLAVLHEERNNGN